MINETKYINKNDTNNTSNNSNNEKDREEEANLRLIPTIVTHLLLMDAQPVSEQ